MRKIVGVCTIIRMRTVVGMGIYIGLGTIVGMGISYRNGHNSWPGDQL